MGALVNVSPAGGKPKSLLEQTREVIRFKHYSLRTEQTYLDWIRRFILFHGKRHPKEMGAPDVTSFLTHLAVTVGRRGKPVLYLRQRLDGKLRRGGQQLFWRSQA
jgi:hypothetical protein